MADRRLGQSDPFGGARGVPFRNQRVEDDEQIEVAIRAMETAIAADAGEPIASRIPSPGSEQRVLDDDLKGETGL